MSSDPFQKNIIDQYGSGIPDKNKPSKKTILKHAGLFFLTLFFVTFTGANFVGYEPVLFPFSIPNTTDILRGLTFAILLLTFLTVHEFGHYFAAVYHRIKVSLPYYIPIPVGIGTLGAVIRIREQIKKMRQMFDVGASGPIAGFIVALTILLIGFATLPEPTVVLNYSGHEELKEYVVNTGMYPDFVTDNTNGLGVLRVGDTLLYSFLASFFDNVPPMWEMYHFPFLWAGWLGLFFTALNLMPVGQLDGGHILYSLIGYKKHKIVAKVFFTGITILAAIDFVPWLMTTIGDYAPGLTDTAWILWAALLYYLMNAAFKGDIRWAIGLSVASLIITAAYLFMAGTTEGQPSFIWFVWSLFIAFFVKVEHPPVQHEEELSTPRKVLGWLSMVIFILCISPNPLYVT